ncbi:trypco2 family protein [Streptomyces bullii]|uniref:Trypco2 family protein n=1 Tax=Streptomyces bullii TaxID=349910 RepID=A0ABW0UXM4_9ACTN
MEIELAAAVAALRDELTRAVEARGAEQEISFQVGFIELEFAVELRQDARGKAGFKAWVVSGDGEAGVARGRTHRVLVTLRPQGTDGDLTIGASRTTPRSTVNGLDRIQD